MKKNTNKAKAAVAGLGVIATVTAGLAFGTVANAAPEYAPQNLGAATEGNVLGASWQPVDVPNFKNYRLQYSPVQGWNPVTVNESTNEAIITGIDSSKAYLVRVATVTTDGQVVYSPWTRTTAPAAPKAPANVIASRYDSGLNTRDRFVKVDWDTSITQGSFVDGYEVQYSTSSTFATVDGTQSIPGFANSTNIEMPNYGKYYFRVKALSQAGDSPFSKISSLKVYSSPASPQNASVSVTSPTSATLTWQAPTDNGGVTLGGYLVEYSASNGLGYPDANLGGSTYKTVLLGADKTSYVMKGLTANTPYVVRVRAVSSLASLGSSTWTETLNVTPTAPLAAATNLNVFATGTVGHAIWTPAPNNSPFSTYRVEVSSTSDFTNIYDSSTVVVDSTSNGTGFYLPDYGKYYVRVVASDTNTAEAVSSTVVSVKSYTAPAAPTDVYASALANYSATIEWTAPTQTGGVPLGGYLVEYSEFSDFTDSITKPVSANRTSTNLTGLTSGAELYVRVKAVSSLASLGTSEFSNTMWTMIPSSGRSQAF